MITHRDLCEELLATRRKWKRQLKSKKIGWPSQNYSGHRGCKMNIKKTEKNAQKTSKNGLGIGVDLVSSLQSKPLPEITREEKETGYM